MLADSGLDFLAWVGSLGRLGDEHAAGNAAAVVVEGMSSCCDARAFWVAQSLNRKLNTREVSAAEMMLRSRSSNV